MNQIGFTDICKKIFDKESPLICKHPRFSSLITLLHNFELKKKDSRKFKIQFSSNFFSFGVAPQSDIYIYQNNRICFSRQNANGNPPLIQIIDWSSCLVITKSQSVFYFNWKQAYLSRYQPTLQIIMSTKLEFIQ